MVTSGNTMANIYIKICVYLCISVVEKTLNNNITQKQTYIP